MGGIVFAFLFNYKIFMNFNGSDCLLTELLMQMVIVHVHMFIKHKCNKYVYIPKYYDIL